MSKCEVDAKDQVKSIKEAHLQQTFEEQTRAYDFVANEYRLRLVVPPEMVEAMQERCLRDVGDDGWDIDEE